jgi:hypothetical protein
MASGRRALSRSKKTGGWDDEMEFQSPRKQLCRGVDRSIGRDGKESNSDKCLMPNTSRDGGAEISK